MSKTVVCPNCKEPMEQVKSSDDLTGWKCLNCGKYISVYRSR